MALGMPGSGGGGGYRASGGPGIGTAIGVGLGNAAPGSINPQQQAALNWLQGASGMNLANYNSSLGAIGAQRNAANAMYGAASAAAGRDYGLTMRGIDLDLKYGNQLRGQEQYRNVDIGRMRSNLDLWNALQNNRITQGDINARRAFAQQGFNLNRQNIGAQYNTGMRQVGSDAIARGARTAAGTLSSFNDVVGEKNRANIGNRLDFNKQNQALKTESQRSSTQTEVARRGHGLDKRTFDSLARTYGIQAAQAIDQAALARDRAAATRSNATGGAGAGRMSALAGLAGQQNSAFQNYFNNQMGLMSQLYGM